MLQAPEDHWVQHQLRWLVACLQVPADPMARAVDCLRILTSGNESNKLALTSSSSSLPSLVRLMDVRLTTDMVLLERAAAVLGNLSTSGDCLDL